MRRALVDARQRSLARSGPVAEPRAFVTDTHPLLLYAAGGRGFGPRAAACFSACERREAIVYVPAAVL